MTSWLKVQNFAASCKLPQETEDVHCPLGAGQASKFFSSDSNTSPLARDWAEPAPLVMSVTERGYGVLKVARSSRIFAWWPQLLASVIPPP